MALASSNPPLVTISVDDGVELLLELVEVEDVETVVVPDIVETALDEVMAAEVDELVQVGRDVVVELSVLEVEALAEVDIVVEMEDSRTLELLEDGPEVGVIDDIVLLGDVAVTVEEVVELPVELETDWELLREELTLEVSWLEVETTRVLEADAWLIEPLAGSDKGPITTLLEATAL